MGEALMASRKKKADEEEAPPKKKGDKAPTRDERAAALLEWVNKKMKGRAQLKMASEYVLPFMTKRMPTGLLTLDVALRGGFPCGGVSQIVGPKNSGKTYLVWQVIRQLQFYMGENLKVLLAMTEMRADRGQARLAGVAISLGDEDIIELEKARVNQGYEKFTKEEREELRREIGTIHEVHGDSAESLFDVILRAVEENAYHLIVLDSIGSIMSGAEAEVESMSQKTYSGAAGPISQFLKHLSGLLTMDDEYGKVRDVCIIGINQIRDAIGDPNKEYRSPGGRALEHAKFVDLLVTSGKAIGYEDQIYTSDGTKKRFIQTGKEVNWKIEKGKAGIHEGARGSYVFDFRTGAGDFYLDTVVAGIRNEVLKQDGSWIRLPNPVDESKTLLKAQGRDAFIAALAEDAQKNQAEGADSSLINLIRAEVFKRNNISINYDWT
jgi:RecA/RadA recombinase